LRIERDNNEICRLSGNLVVIHVPVRLIDETYEGQVTLRSTVGRFEPLEMSWQVRNGFPAILSFGIPRQFFLRDERVELSALEVDDRGRETVLWSQTYRASWLTTVPRLDPVPA
jgi:hypothetical protein